MTGPSDHEAADAGEARAAAVVAGLVNHCIFHHDQPVRGVRRYRRDVVIEKFPKLDEMGELLAVGGRRGEIREFSFQSRMRLLFIVKNCNADFRSMLTITYPSDFPRDGRQVKRDLDVFKKWIQRRIPGVLGIWFLEFQRRGAPHFHFLLDADLRSYGDTILKRRTGKLRGHSKDTYETEPRSEADVSAAWYRIVGSGDEKHLRAGVSWEVLESEEAAMKYAAQHAAKPHQKAVPLEYLNVGRFWGKLGKIQLVGGDELEHMSTEQIFEQFGYAALSSKGRVKKYLYDASLERD